MIQLDQVSLRRGGRVLFQKASMQIHPGWKVGLTGVNGAGKSTLFAALLGSIGPDDGTLSRPAVWTVAHMAQEVKALDMAAIDFVLTGDEEYWNIQQQLNHPEQLTDTELADLHGRFDEINGYSAPAKAAQLMAGLGFMEHQNQLLVSSFSGGWRMRLNLARTLMSRSDLLLLDEPTNHLDLDAILWLEDWLKAYEGTLVLISHDRDFLDAITDHILHIENQELTLYTGNYSTFETTRSERLAQQQQAFEKQQETRAHLQKFIDRFKAKATKAKQAQSRVKAIERMEKIAPILGQREFTFEFREPDHLPNPMLSIQDAALGYGQTTILHGISRSVLAGQRIGILGANGQGKSTLVKTIAEQIQAISGEITPGKGLSIGYFAQQELDILHADLNPLEHMVRLAKVCSPQATEQELRNFLGSFLFTGDMVSQTVGSMSGGEKARLVLALIVWQKPNLLLLDEPTNHLDLATRDALAMALNGFDGAMLLVSHDRALLRSTCDDFWLVAAGKVQSFQGDLDDYQRYLLDHAKALREAARLQNPAAPSRADDGLSHKERREREQQQRQAKLAQLRPLKKELLQLETAIDQLSAEQSQLHTTLAGNPQPEEIIQASKRLASVNTQLESAELRWLEISEAIEILETA